MDEATQISENVQQAETLETEVKKFANDRTYWAKYLAEKILSGTHVSDKDIETSYSYLLEELKLKKDSEKSEISINYNANNFGNFKPDLIFTKLENVEGVNALTDNQVIEFSPNLTIIYGRNGSGKSGYVRLLKKAFYSKASEEIIPNIHLESGHKPINAKFTFKADNIENSLIYPANSANAEFEQYAVFDVKSVIAHLDRRNEFEFRPAGLSFFADFTDAINKVEQKLNSEIASKQSENNFTFWFEGESEIKTIVQNLSAQTKLDDLKKYTPFTEEENLEKEKIEQQYDELILASKGKEKEIQLLENIKKLLCENKKAIEALNKFFGVEYLTQVKSSITDCVEKEATAKAEGIESFKTDKIEGVGTTEWKNFIIAAEEFANNQKEQDAVYPQNGDNCLLCHQPLSADALKLIANYWAFIKSVAEEDSKKAKETLDKTKSEIEKLKLDLFPAENTLTSWLSEKHPTILLSLKQKLSEQKILAGNIISDISSKIVNKRTEIIIAFEEHDRIESSIDNSIKMLKENEQGIMLENLLKKKTLLIHKEKFNTHFSKFESYINRQSWIKTAGKANFDKRKITDTEKILSDRYFNQKYIDTFNIECNNLNGSFGIEISHTGSAGKSYRQLKLKGRNPNAVLSEGEQKVIAIADFLSEMQLSEVNRGIIFDDPVTSLDETRKSEIAERLVKEAVSKQVIIFTHDLVFVSYLINHSKDKSTVCDCHWIITENNKVGNVYLNNTPSHDKKYRNTQPALECYSKAKNAPPEEREKQLKYGFAALRTCYETFVINDLFANIVQRFNDRVSVMSLSSIYYDDEIINEIIANFERCCKYMEGHTHSDNFLPLKPEPKTLLEEINVLDNLKKKYNGILKAKGKK